MKQRLIGAWVVAAVLFAAAPGAFAFQFVNPDSNSGGTTNFTDPDQQTQKLTNRFGSGNGSSSGCPVAAATTMAPRPLYKKNSCRALRRTRFPRRVGDGSLLAALV